MTKVPTITTRQTLRIDINSLVHVLTDAGMISDVCAPITCINEDGVSIEEIFLSWNSTTKEVDLS